MPATGAQRVDGCMPAGLLHYGKSSAGEIMIPDFTHTRLLVVGDAMLDVYVETEVRRISPEAPVPVADVRSRWSVPGGAANVARNLVSLGCRASLLALCGTDAAAATLRSAKMTTWRVSSGRPFRR